MKQFFWVIIILVSYGGNLFSQQYPYTYVSSKEGLPQTSVYKIIQDSVGYIWFVTEGGICRYDGVSFKNYSYQDGIHANFILDAEFSPQNTLWISSHGGGIAYFDGVKFHSLGEESGIPDNIIHRIEFTDNNELVLLSKSKGLFLLSYSDKLKIRQIGKKKEYETILNIKKIDSFYYICSNRGLFKTNQQFNVIDTIIKNRYVSNVIKGRDSSLWLCGIDYLQNITGDSVKNYSHLFSDNTEIMDVYESNSGETYVSTYKGLLILKDTTHQLLGVENGIPYQFVHTIMKDRFGNLWLGSYGNGAAIINSKGMIHFSRSPLGSDLCTFGFYELSNKNMLVAEFSGSLYEIDDNNMVIESELNIRNNIQGSHQILHSIKNDGSFYLLSNRKSIYQIKDGQIIWQWENTLPNGIFYIIESDENHFMLLTDAGVFILHKESMQIKLETRIPISFYFYAFRTNDAIWLIEYNGKVFEYKKSRYIEHSEEINPNKTLLQQGLYDKKHDLYWFCTSAGLLVWNYKNNFLLTSKNYLKSDQIWSVTQDSLGRIWCGHIKGVECIDVDNHKVISVGYDQGFLPIETNAQTAYTDSKGDVWFGTINSASKIIISEWGKNNITGKLVIQEILVNKKTVYQEIGFEPHVNEIRLPYNQNNIRFDIQSICFENAKDVEYTWKLDGLDNEWETEKNKTSIEYNNLKPGEYTFYAVAKNPNGYITNQISIPFTINKPFWSTFGFYLTEFLIYSILVFLSFRFTSNKKNRLGNIMTLLLIFITFESLILFVSQYTDPYTENIPVFQLIMNVILAASLHPLENFIKKFIQKIATKSS